MNNKTWTTCGFFKNYNEAQEKITELEDEFELYKIKRVKEKSKEGLFKLKAWKAPVVKPQKKKKQKKTKKNE